MEVNDYFFTIYLSNLFTTTIYLISTLVIDEIYNRSVKQKREEGKKTEHRE